MANEIFSVRQTIRQTESLTTSLLAELSLATFFYDRDGKRL